MSLKPVKLLLKQGWEVHSGDHILFFECDDFENALETAYSLAEKKRTILEVAYKSKVFKTSFSEKPITEGV